MTDTSEKQLKILVVDDEEDLRDIYTYRLEADGFDVVAANGCGEAMKLATQDPGDIAVILTDIMMPDGDGLELVAYAVSHKIPVVIATAYAAKIAPQVPAHVQILSKPFDLDELSGALQTEIQRRENSRL